MSTHYIHDMDPVIFSLGPLSVRWYGMMYLVGFAAAFLVLRWKHRQGLWALNALQTQDLITYLLAGMVLGARFFYVLIYNPSILNESFWNLFAVWQGGLSYHGAVIGFSVAMWLYGRKHGYGFLHLADYVCLGAALGVFFGRFGNFANGELWGRTTDVPWAMIFSATGGGPLPRHPSQLYQGIGEGLIVFFLLLLVEWRERAKGFAPDKEKLMQELDGKKKKKAKADLRWERTGVLACCYVMLYGTARFIIEFFRQPDPQLGFYFGWMTMGQILCLIMILVGTIVLVKKTKNPTPIEFPLK